MIGTLDRSLKKVTVIGGGISGLLAAYAYDRAGFEVTLHERAPRVGGLIRTVRTEHGIVESAAHSLRVTPVLKKLCEELDIPLVPLRARERYILRDGKMRRFPLTSCEAARAFLRAYFALSKPEVSSGRATVDRWAERHLGKAALEHLVAPALQGIYSARPSELCVGAALQNLQIPRGHSLLSFLLRKARTGSRQKAELMAPRQGMQSLVDALDERLRSRLGARYRVGDPIERLPTDTNLVLSVPAREAGRLVMDKDPRLSRALLSLPYAPLASVTAFIPRSAFSKEPPRGVGVLIPESERKKSLGILFSSSSFEGRVQDEENRVSLSVFLGGTLHPELVQREPQELERIVRGELGSILGVSPGSENLALFTTRWSQAIPVHGPGILDVWDAAREGWCSRPGRILFGNYVGQVSIRGMIQSLMVNL